MDFTNSYNTQLNPFGEVLFQNWLATRSKALGRPLDRDLENYDLRGYWVNGGFSDSGTGHMTDKFKKPNHPTFSDESQYHGVDDPSLGKLEGGRWIGDDSTGWSFQPSQTMMSKTHSADELRQYFADIEPDVQLVMPPKFVDNSGRKKRSALRREVY